MASTMGTARGRTQASWRPFPESSVFSPPAVTVSKPIKQTIIDKDEYVGRFVAVNAVEVRGRVSGYLEQVHFTDGQLVKQGDLLFTIDRRPYQAAYDAAKSQVDVASSLLEFSKTQLDRADQLAKSGNLSA